MKQIHQQIYERDIYEGFDSFGYTLDLQGWGGIHPLFERLIATINPRIVIEIGTWKGQSAITMAQHAKKYCPSAEIICIDTWLGSAEHWRHRTAKLNSFYSLKHKHGYPQLYYQFLANVIMTGCTDIITPLPMHSVAAAKYLESLNVKADVIYIDASHDYASVKLDIQLYANLLAPGGVLFGDDYNMRLWPGVVRAVNECARESKRQVVEHEGKWQFV